jgi:Reverse transcriptase (RNA-dependent DNA polymerase)
LLQYCTYSPVKSSCYKFWLGESTRNFSSGCLIKLSNELLDDDIDSDIVAVLAVWYSEQDNCIQWKNVFSSKFSTGIGNGTRQGGIVPRYLFTWFICELIAGIVQSNIGRNIGNVFCNIFAYADDLVLLAPSWKAMQSLIKFFSQCAQNTDI